MWDLASWSPSVTELSIVLIWLRLVQSKSTGVPIGQSGVKGFVLLGTIFTECLFMNALTVCNEALALQRQLYCNPMKTQIMVKGVSLGDPFDRHIAGD
jgi:hypothetical protein